MPELKLFNSLTREKQVFIPIDEKHIRVYACGPTVYNYAHIGNARMAVVFDLLARVLRTLYPKVTYISNITDVDDKIIAASKETGEAIEVITQKYAKIYNQDMAALGAAEPDIQPKATEHIGEMIALIEKLLAQNHAYESEGHVLFHVPSFEKYGGLSGRSRDEQIAGARVEVASYKKDPADFILWKPSPDDVVGWDSPWGRGRPGWHIECSAMAEKHLGLPFDIHGGGADLKFPHHENEIAQSCCANGHQDDLSAFAKYWVHNGFVTVEGEKMSKSLGNVQLAHDLLDKYKGSVLRLALFSAQYSKPLDWTVRRIKDSQNLFDKISRIWEDLSDIEESEEPYGDFYDSFFDALCDDLNTPLALSKINALLSSIRKDMHSRIDRNLPSQKFQLGKIISLLGIDVENQQINSDDPDIAALVAQRDAAKADKNWARADKIRDQLLKQGIVIEDSRDGTKWRKA